MGGPGTERSSRSPVLRAHQQLIGLRRRHPWLVTARTESLHLENARYTYRATAADGGEHLDVEIDLEADPRVVIRGARGEVLWSQERL